MAPIPTAIDEETQELLERTRRRQTDLVESQIPRLRQCTGSLAAQQALATGVRDDLDTFARLLEVRTHDFTPGIVSPKGVVSLPHCRGQSLANSAPRGR